MPIYLFIWEPDLQTLHRYVPEQRFKRRKSKIQNSTQTPKVLLRQN